MEERLKITANVSRPMANPMLTKERGIAMTAQTTGARVRITEPRISRRVISGFFMCSEKRT